MQKDFDEIIDENIRLGILNIDFYENFKELEWKFSFNNGEPVAWKNQYIDGNEVSILVYMKSRAYEISVRK